MPRPQWSTPGTFVNAPTGGVLALVVCLAIATGGLVWLGYRATREWQRATQQSSERRAAEVLALLASALDRDMKGAQVSVLLPLNHQTLVVDPPYDLAERFAKAFARFPYPESFFAVRSPDPDGRHVYVFNRSDRLPPWHQPDAPRDPYPVEVLRGLTALAPALDEAVRQTRYGARFAVFETTIAGVPYQVVVHAIYRTGGSVREVTPRLFGVAGFTVNLDWVSREYFADLIRQVHRIGGSDEALQLRIADERGAVIAASGGVTRRGSLRARRFPLLFFDRTLLSSLSPPRPQVRQWNAQVSIAPDSAAGRGAQGTFALMALAALVTIAALTLTVGAVRASTELAAMKSDFVSTVTHELKTPLALIRLVGETLQRGRYTTPDIVGDYAKLLSQEANHLTRLIDNLLTYARVNDSRRLYAFERVEVIDLMEETLDHFHPRLAELGFEVTMDIPLRLPPVRADRVTLRQAIENLIDNAINYSGERKVIRISAAAADGCVRLEIADEGIGIPEDEVARVFEKFYRGRRAGRRGSGLGLAIARRIVRDHGGAIDLRSTFGSGTSVEIQLPVSDAA